MFFCFLWQWAMSFPGWTYLLQKRWGALKNIHIELIFFGANISYWVIGVIDSTAESMLSKYDNQDTKECDCKTMQCQGTLVLKKYWLAENTVRYVMPIGWRFMT